MSEDRRIPGSIAEYLIELPGTGAGARGRGRAPGADRRPGGG